MSTQVSCIGFGAWPIGGAHGNVEREVGHDAVVTAVEEVGMTFVDTAEAYDREQQIGGSGGSLEPPGPLS